jgi:stage II sporulation protein AA (anti-sigma F factor antagonist)
VRRKPTEPLLVDCVQEKGALVVTPHGDGGYRQAELLGAALSKIAAGRPAKVTLNLSRLTFIDSVGMGVLISFKHALAREGGRLALADVPPHIAEVLRVSRLLEWLSSDSVGGGGANGASAFKDA